MRKNNLNHPFIIIIYTILSILLNSCSESRTCDKIVEILTKEPKSNRDFAQLVNLLNNNIECAKSIEGLNYIVNDRNLDTTKLKELYFRTTTNPQPNKKVATQLFLENSASMWGYFEGATECEKAMSKIVIHCRHGFGEDNFKFFFITNNVLEPSIPKNDVLGFISKIEPKQLKIGNFKNTEISDILRTVIDKTGTDTLSILITDCIYSKQEEGSTNQTVNYEWSLIEDAFLSRLSEAEISVLINKYSSTYKGNYVSIDNSTNKKVINKVGYKEHFVRPYYVIVIGSNEDMKVAISNFEFKNYPGYQYSYLITHPKTPALVNYRILNSYKIGRFLPDKKDPQHTIVDAEKESRGRHKGKFQFAIAADLSQLAIENDYIMDANKYKISSKYDIVIQNITEDMRNKNSMLDGYTHLFLLETHSNPKEEALKISLKRETPGWVLATHTDDDLSLDSLHQTQSRGFKYLVEGIESAFDRAQHKAKGQNYEKNYFTLNVNIKL